MPKAALFFPSFFGGGVQRVMVNLASGLMRAGVDVDLVVLQARGPFLDTAPQGARLVDLGARRALSGVTPLVRYLRAERPTALLSAQPHINVIATWAHRMAGTGTRLVISEHSHMSTATRTAGFSGDRLRPLMARLFYPHADAIVAVSQGVADDLARAAGIPAERIRVIYNPVDVTAIQAGAQEEPAHPWFGPGEPPVILAAGRLALEKDYPTLLRAFALLHPLRSARLIILGEGPERARLEALAENLGIRSQVELAGYVDNPFACMARAGVYVLSSMREGFPNALVEALACGAPVVSTDCPSGPAEILENGRYGRLVPVGDAQALAEAIVETLDDPLPGAVMRARAAEFSVERAVQAYREVLFA